MDKSLLGWLLLLGLGFPLLSILLSEAASRLERQQHPLAVTLRQVREYVLPPLAVLLTMRQVLSVAGDSWVRPVETLTWIAVIVAGVSLINTLLTTTKPQIKWQLQVPNLFFQMARASVVLGIVYYLISGVWNISLSGLGTSLGVASAVIALALQDTLSNLVSGLLLLFANPFKLNDWIELDGNQGRVIEQNWWSVTIENYFFKINIPNGELSKASIINYGPGPIWKSVSVSFSYNDPPGAVIPALNSLVEGIDQIKSEGFAEVSSYEDSSITYELWYKVLPEEDEDASDELKGRMYYLAQRYGFTMPYPMKAQYSLNTTQGIPSKMPQVAENRRQDLVTYLRSLPCFVTLTENQIKNLAEQSRFQSYGKGELIIQEGKEDQGLYIMLKGRGEAYVKDEQGHRHIVDQLGINAVFGEMATFPGEVSPVTVIANEDVEIVLIPAKEIVEAIESNEKFASEILEYIEERKKIVRLTTGIKHEASPRMSNNGRRGQVRS